MAIRTIPANPLTVNIPEAVEALSRVNRKIAALLEAEIERKGSPTLIAALREVDESLYDGIEPLRMLQQTTTSRSEWRAQP